MFTVKAGYSNDIEIRSSADKVREFFLDITNFADLMPGVMQVHTDAKGIAHWKIETTVPVVGQILQKFALQLAEKLTCYILNAYDRVRGVTPQPYGAPGGR